MINEEQMDRLRMVRDQIANSSHIDRHAAFLALQQEMQSRLQA